MPIFFMALLALGLFIAMGLMLFYAAYCEAKEAHRAPGETQKFAAELKTHAPVA